LQGTPELSATENSPSNIQDKAMSPPHPAARRFISEVEEQLPPTAEPTTINEKTTQSAGLDITQEVSLLREIKDIQDCWHDKGGVESKQLQLYKTLDKDLTD
jgi:hypothetical protein